MISCTEPLTLSPYSDRLFGFQITTSAGSELLLQVDSYSTALKWFDAIRKAINISVSISLYFSFSLVVSPA